MSPVVNLSLPIRIFPSLMRIKMLFRVDCRIIVVRILWMSNKRQKTMRLIKRMRIVKAKNRKHRLMIKINVFYVRLLYLNMNRRYQTSFIIMPKKDVRLENYFKELSRSF